MFKKILFLNLFFYTYIFAVNDPISDFIESQIIVESKFFDQNLSIDEKLDIKEKQEVQYRMFFLKYGSNKEENLKIVHPYRRQIAKLKLRLKENKHRGNSNAVLRDEVQLQGFETRKMIRDILHDTLMATDSHSKEYFLENVEKILLKYLSKHTVLDKSIYNKKDTNQTSPIRIALSQAIIRQDHLESVLNTFSTELTQQSHIIKKSARLSESRFFRILNTINTSPYGLSINNYLSAINLDIAKVMFVILVIFILLLVQYLLHFINNHILHHYKLKEEEIKYIHAHITKLFNIIISVMIVHIILVSFFGMDIKSISISKFFAIFYVLTIAIIIYRITNTLAHLKMEQMKNNKMIKNEVINLTIKIANGLVFIIAIIAILQIIGVNLTALLSALGILGAAIAFAAKDSIANVFASISILIGDIFEQGDWIETSTVNGTVVEIGLRASTIRTFDNALISIPNSELANDSVKNWSRRSIGRRIKMTIGVTYQSDFNDIYQAILDIREMLKEHPGIANQRTEYKNSARQSKLVSIEDYKGIKRTTLVYMDEFSDSSINILVYCFSRTVVWEEWLEVKEDVMFKIAAILEKNKLDFAYPSLALYHPEAEYRRDEEPSSNLMP